jgi:hypothetical protein
MTRVSCFFERGREEVRLTIYVDKLRAQTQKLSDYASLSARESKRTCFGKLVINAIQNFQNGKPQTE